LDTVVGLSLTSTSVGWVLVEGRDAGGSILDHDYFAVPPAAGVQAVYTSERASAAVLDAQGAAAEHDQRLHVVGVTWSDESAAEAALLLESLTDAGFDKVVPIRLHDACDVLARAIAPVVGYDKAAVCVLDGESTIVVMVDTDDDDEPQTAVKQLSGGPGHLIHWLTALFDRSSWQPGGIVIVGADDDLDALSRRLEKAVPVPVIMQTGAGLALARGAALASAQSTEFTDTEMVEALDSAGRGSQASRPRSYAGALTMLAAGAVTFVASLSLAVGPHLVPSRGPGPVAPVARRAAPAAVAIAPAPPRAAIKLPAARPAPKPAPAEEPAPAPVVEPQTVASQGPADVRVAQPVPPPAPPPPEAPPPPPEPNPHPLLTKLLERLHGQAPDQQPPAQAPPPPPAPPSR
jgi:hypothetical protein